MGCWRAMRTVSLTAYQMAICKLFSEESAKTQQQIEFGDARTKPRSAKEIARDNMIGKMAEAAVCNILHECGDTQAAVNYEILPRGMCDWYDMTVNGWTLDIKSTRCGKWLLFDCNKARFRGRSGTMPDVIVMCRTAWDTVKDTPQGANVDVYGCVSMDRLQRPDGTKVRLLRAGEAIPGTECRLQTDNFGIRVEDLTDFAVAAKWMIGHKKNTLGGTYGKEQSA